MTVRLGLDLGSNSLGWCLVEVDADGRDDRFIGIGSRIFSDGRVPKSGASLAVDRRKARAARRRRDRFIGRRSAFMQALREFGLMPTERAAAKALEKLGPYELRAKALDEKLEPYHLGRALFHLNQRRGFKSNRKTERKDKDSEKEQAKIASGAKALDEAMKKLDARTYGEFLFKKAKKNEAGGKKAEMRVRMGGKNQAYDFYPERRHYEKEFEKIWEKQAGFHPDLPTGEARKRLYDILFYQRDLRPQEVGACTFAGVNGVPKVARRLPRAHPLFQETRLYQEVNQLEVTAPGERSRKLTLDERDRLIMRLSKSKRVTFKSLGKLLKLADGESFNKASENRKHLIGNETFAEFSNKKRLGNRWAHFSPDERWTIIERVKDEQDPVKLHDWLTREYDLDEDTAREVAAAKIPEGYGRLGEMATRAILTELKEDVITYDEAVRRAGFASHSDLDRTGEILDQLPYYGEVLARDIPPGSLDSREKNPEVRWGRITNPTVHIGLNQLRRVVNAIIARHGRPDEIVIELGRELKMSEKQKADYRRTLKKNTAAAKRRSETLLAMGKPDSGANRMLLRLWEESNPADALNRRCAYCGVQIKAGMLMNGGIDIDHVIPYSRSLDDSASNKVVVHRHCNREKDDKTPWGKWGGTDRWPVIAEQVGYLHKSKQWRFGPDAMERVERDGGFIARQLNDTQYLSRMAGKYLNRLYEAEREAGERRVFVIPGRMAAMLRRLWGLNDILWDHNIVENPHSNAPKNRLDHRHHAIDAAVVAVTRNSLLMQVARAAARAEARELDRLFADLPQPWPGFREELRDVVTATVVSHKAEHGLGKKALKDPQQTAAQLHNDTAYGLTGEVNEKDVPIIRYRVPLLGLKPKDFMDPDRIVDTDLRDALYRATQGLSGRDYYRALEEFSKRSGPYQGIRRVRIRKPLNVIPVRDKSGKAYKAYQGDANSRYDIWQMPPDKKGRRKWVAVVISTFDIHQPDFDEQARRPHPAAKKIMSLRQDDLIAIERDGGPRQIMRVQKYNQSGQIYIVEHNEAGNLTQRDKNPDDRFKMFGPYPSRLQKMKARQIRIDELGEIRDPGPRE